MRRAHRHDDLELNYMRRGWYRYLVGGEVVTLEAGGVLALWGAFPHQSVGAASEASMCWATLPLSDAMAMGLPDGLMGRLLSRGFALDERGGPGDEAMFMRWAWDLGEAREGGGRAVGRADDRGGRRARGGGVERAEVRHIVALEVEARLRRLAMDRRGAGVGRAGVKGGGGSADGGEVELESGTEGGTLDTVAAMARLIAERHRRPLRVAEVASAVGLNPSYAMTLFRRKTGTTINQYLNRQRVAHAQRMLVTGDDGVTEIALAAGFGSISRFYEAFNEATGMSPKAFRRRVRGGQGRGRGQGSG